MFSIGSLARKWSMRKTWRSGKTVWMTRLSSRAEARSLPNGFSTTMRA